MATFPSVTGLVLRLRANAITGLSDGDPVATWADESTESNDATASGSARPTYRASGGPNDSSYVEFNGTSHIMSCGDPASLQVSDFSIFVVASVASAIAGIRRIVMYSAGSDSSNFGRGYGMFFGRDTVTAIKGSGDGSEEQCVANRVNQAVDIYEFAEAHYTDASDLSVESKDTNSNTCTPDTDSISYTNVTDFHVGGFNTGSFNYFDGNIVEVIVCDTEQSASEKSAITEYIQAEYFPDEFSGQAAGFLQVNGSNIYTTTWRSGTMYLDRLNTSLVSQNSVSFGVATSQQWYAREYYLSCYSGDIDATSTVYGFGRFVLSTEKHLLKSTDGGATFGANLGDASWAGSYLSALFVPSTNILFAAIYNVSTGAASLWRSQNGATDWVQLVALPTGFECVAMSIDGNGRLLLANRRDTSEQALLLTGLYSSYTDVSTGLSGGLGAILWG